MKAFFLTGSIIFTVLILILAFGNINASMSGLHFLFYPVDMNPTVVILGISVLGIITGVLYHSFLSRILGSSEEEEETF